MTSLAGANQDEVRRSNLSLVLTLLHRHGAQSRSRIVATTGLNRSTVGDLVSELVAAGLVRESAGVGGGVGRPSLVVKPVAESAVALALDVRVERTVAALVGLGGEVFVRREQRYSASSEDSLLQEVIDISRQVIADGPASAILVGIGVGVPGVVRTDDGLVRFAPNLGWIDTPLGDMLAEAMDDLVESARSIEVRNDSDLGVLAEHLRGAARGAENLVYLGGDVGIGGGVIIDGRPLVGVGGYGGEVGHMRINPQGVVCRCGARGCWETEIGREAILRAAQWDPESPEADVLDVVRAAERGDAKAQSGLAHVADWLGLGLVNLVNVFNPQTIVLGGHLGHIYAAQRPEVERHLDTALPAPREQVSVVVTDLGGDATLVGAGEVAFTQLLADPVGVLSRLDRAS